MRGTLFGLFLAIFCSLAHAESKAWLDGESEARQDIGSGMVKYMLYGQPAGSDRILAEVLKKDYGITLVIVGGCTVSVEAKERANGYNAVMLEHFKETSKVDIIAEAQAKARKQWEQEHAKANPDGGASSVSPGR